MYVITGATGRLGRLVITECLKIAPAGEIIALAREPASAADLEAKGVQVRKADYDRPDTLHAALVGGRRLLLISSNKTGSRVAQHQAVIDAAQSARIELLAYTSLLHADTTPARLADDHKATERAIATSGLPAVILRNGWYTENHLVGLKATLEHGALLGAAGQGRFSSAPRADYAAAAAKVLTSKYQAGKTYELAGDQAYTLSEFAEELSSKSGKRVAYRDQSEADYKALLLKFGVPEPQADILANQDHVARGDTLFDDSHALSRLVGRPTTSMPDTIAAALKAMG